MSVSTSMASPDHASDRLDALDGLRGFACMIVVISHFSSYTWTFPKILSFGAGQIGVMMFFALSGYLMSYIYLNSTLSLNSLRKYVVRRLSRILPLYYLVVISAFVVNSVYGTKLYNLTDANIDEALFLIKAQNVLWTIPVEVKFYMIFPIFVMIAAVFGNIFFAVVMACVVLYMLAYFDQKGVSVLQTGHYFLIGIIAQIVNAKIKDRLWSIVANGAFLVALLMTLLSFPGVRAILGIPVANMWNDPVVMAALFVMFVVVSRSSLANLLFANRPMMFLGMISFSLYLLHGPVSNAMNFYGPISKTDTGSLAVFVAGSIVVSTLSYYLIEKSSRDWLNQRLS
jgi:peptidoglycan/LPS O-acetylase OafA/YrhL